MADQEKKWPNGSQRSTPMVELNISQSQTGHLPQAKPKTLNQISGTSDAPTDITDPTDIHCHKQFSSESPLKLSPPKFTRVPRTKLAPLKRQAPVRDDGDVFGTSSAPKRIKMDFTAPRKKEVIEMDLTEDEHVGGDSPPMTDHDGYAPEEEDGGMEEDDRPERRNVEQWKVGRLPGHQGSHVHTPRRGSERKGISSCQKSGNKLKRSLSQVSPTTKHQQGQSASR
jgi:hypothetical protein